MSSLIIFTLFAALLRFNLWLYVLCISLINLSIDLFCVWLSDPKYLVMAEDIKPRAGCVEDWRLNIGGKLATFAERLQEKVVVMISGDLSHCHPTNCTDALYLPSPR